MHHYVKFGLNHSFFYHVAVFVGETRKDAYISKYHTIVHTISTHDTVRRYDEILASYKIYAAS